MDNAKKRRNRARRNRVLRVRKTLLGSAERPRLSVSKTNCHIYAQLIDDESSKTIAGFGTKSKNASVKGRSKESAREIGQKIAAAALEQNISTVVFDRGRYKFHGIVAELANSAREAGLQF